MKKKNAIFVSVPSLNAIILLIDLSEQLERNHDEMIWRINDVS